MEPITSWSEETVCQWLQGLDAPLHRYAVSEWHLSGLELLQLTSEDLHRLGVSKIGHQELILEAVEKLCSLTYGSGGENLQGFTEKLRAVAHTLQMGIQGRWRHNSDDGQTATRLPTSVLHVVVELISSAKGLFSLLNRYQFSQLSGHATSKKIFGHCKELGEIVQKKNTSVYEKEKDIISVCRQLVVVCDEILSCSSETLLTNTAKLESVDLVPVSPGEHLGIEITSIGSSSHYVTGTATEPSSDVAKILAGDEVIKVNNQIVVGWSRANLVKKLRENPSGVTLVLKKSSGSLTRRDPVRRIPTAQEEDDDDKEDSLEEEEEEEEGEEDNPRHSIFERVAASVRSLSFRRAVQGPEVTEEPIGQEESELSADKELEGGLTPYQDQQEDSSLLSASGEFYSLAGSRLSPGLTRRARTPSPRSISPYGFFGNSSSLDIRQDRASVCSCPEMVGHTGNKDTKKSSTKGMSTALSRRRVSCRELVLPDCDGWLWKKRRESSVFIAQKWQRFWFVLKGPCLYWYTSQQEEKAEGLVNISSYKIAGAGEHKRKYVFNMCHEHFRNFFFAADHVSDMSKWINALITAIQKHEKLSPGPESEEECYSETESETESSPSPRRRNKKVQSSTLPRRKRNKTNKVPLSSPATGGSKGTVPEDEMGKMLNNIKEGGVSLMGHEQPLTHDHFRRSFIRRNKNPVINEKAHTLRALQSTLKAKEAELQQLNKILEGSTLTASKYRQWKEQNEELVQEIERLAALRASKVGNDSPVQDTPADEVALETVGKETTSAETKGAYRLSLSDGEQLVDGEPSDVLLDVSQGSLAAVESSPMLELSLGSLQESINKQLSEMRESGEASETYFYI
ncbi:connector enhancer of kinase suppressor of ras 1 isoform X2 [Dunckerocampus dactyliophorus]|uniref:connector enhancer of kinase suppressor of ras 1 isoform X2 n=1 Tax=Dunckerocampus dactyliophorus TaxID=161453 RepID=UPI002406E0F9|nr:connector enhancer of kinase suppressor of ras 1 isoform X2 [Dunckerocampus dactyliophorus]